MNGVNKNGETVIHAAAYKQVPSAAQFLIEKGAKIEFWNQKNKMGWTPLRIADGVVIGEFRQTSPAMAAVLREVMSAAGVSTVVEADIERGGAGEHDENAKVKAKVAAAAAAAERSAK